MIKYSLILDSEIAKYLKGRDIIKVGENLEGVVLNYNQNKKALIDFGSFRVEYWQMWKNL